MVCQSECVSDDLGFLLNDQSVRVPLGGIMGGKMIMVNGAEGGSIIYKFFQT